MKKLSIGRAALIAAVLTLISFFRGGVRYPAGGADFPPVWMQLACNFAIYFVCFWGLTVLACWLYGKLKK